jgi:hypothetical protein
VVRINTGAAEALNGVLAVLTQLNAPRMVDKKDQELLVLQSAAIGFGRPVIAAVVAESSEIARHAAGTEVHKAPPEFNAPMEPHMLFPPSGLGGLVRTRAGPGSSHLPACRRRIRLKVRGSRPLRARFSAQPLAIPGGGYLAVRPTLMLFRAGVTELVSLPDAGLIRGFVPRNVIPEEAADQLAATSPRSVEA